MNRKRLPIESGIYRIMNRVTSTYYIGKAENIRVRISHHWSLLKQGLHPNKLLQKDWEIYGEVAFSVKVVKVVAKKNLEMHETRVLKQYLEGGFTIYNRC